MGDESVANHSAAPTSRKLELRHIYTVVQQWLDAQRASEWVLGQIQERWRALGDSRSPLTERLRDLSGKRAWNLAKLADFDKWNPLRQGRRKFGIAAWLLDFVAALHPEALLDVERTLALGETSPEVGIEDELSADLAAINHSLGGHELRVALVGRVVLRRRVRMNTPPMQESELLHDDVGAGGLKANEADATDELATHATALIGQIATIPVHDPFWDQLDAFVARIRDLARDVHRRREIDAEADRRRDLARQLLDTLSAVWATYEDVIHWLGLAQPSVPEAIELTAHSAASRSEGSRPAPGERRERWYSPG